MALGTPAGVCSLGGQSRGRLCPQPVKSELNSGLVSEVLATCQRLLTLPGISAS